MLKLYPWLKLYSCLGFHSPFLEFNKVVQIRIGDHDLDTMGDTPIEKTVNVRRLVSHPKHICNGPWVLLLNNES